MQFEKYADIAKAFRTSEPRVCQIVQQVLKKKGALEKIQAQRDTVEQQESKTKSVVSQMVAENVHIDSARTVQRRIFDEQALEVPLKRIQKVMRKDLDMAMPKSKAFLCMPILKLIWFCGRDLQSNCCSSARRKLFSSIWMKPGWIRVTTVAKSGGRRTLQIQSQLCRCSREFR